MQDRDCAPQECGTNFREAVCIHTDKVLDSCRDKDCLEDLRVYLTQSGQEIVDRAMNIKCVKAETIQVMTDIDNVPFNRGFYSIDLRYFFKITLQVFTGQCRPTEVEGLAAFDKKVILFGSEGNAKIFTSADSIGDIGRKKANMPKAVVEVVDPIALGAKVTDVCRHDCCCCDDDVDIAAVPDAICSMFDGSLIVGGEAKRAFVSLGVFSIIKLERRVQLLIPSYDYCIPQKECVGAADDDPCELFDKIRFPMDEFYPPEKCDFLEDDRRDPSCCCK